MVEELTAIPDFESLVGIKMFSPEAGEYIKQKRLKTYPLLELSIAQLQTRSGRKLEYPRGVDPSDFKAQKSRRSEIAIDPEEFFLEETSGKPYNQLQRICDRLITDTPEVSGIIGTIADYFELYVTHLKATGEDLFGIQHNYNAAVAEFPLDKSKIAIMGKLLEDNDSLIVIILSRDSIYPGQILAPLIVPNS